MWKKLDKLSKIIIVISIIAIVAFLGVFMLSEEHKSLLKKNNTLINANNNLKETMIKVSREGIKYKSKK